MADALVERRPTPRFFCHRCNVEFEAVLQDFTCPYCASGFIEQLEAEAEATLSSDEFSDADMSNLDDVSTLDDNLDDSDEMLQNAPPAMLNDLAFLMSGGRVRISSGGNVNVNVSVDNATSSGAGRRETLMEQLVWMIGGARPGGGGGAVSAGTPFVLVGAPGDYVFGGEGLDAVVTQLLGQLENAGPPPLPRDQIAALPSEHVNAEQAAANTSCSVCWENFQLDETISRLECDHIFHSSCIAPWLQLHATCPICRRSLLPEEQRAAEAPPPPASEGTSTTHSETSSMTSLPRVLLRRYPRRRATPAGTGASQRWEVADTSSSSSSSSTATSAGWPPAPAPAANSTSTTSSSSLNSSDRERQMDIDYD